MPLTPEAVGALLRANRLRLRLSQPDAARRACVSTRLWSEAERGERPNVSFATLLHMLGIVGVALEPAALPDPSQESAARRALSSEQLDALREDLRQAAAYGVDLSLIRAGLALTPLERVERNDEALAFFDSVTVEPGWKPPEARTRPLAARRSAR